MPRISSASARLGPNGEDKSAAVLSCVASTLRAVAQHDSDLALELFLKIDFQDDKLLATVHMYEIIRNGLLKHYKDFRPYVERMLRSDDPATCEAGGCLAAIAALEHSDAASLRDQATTGNRTYTNRSGAGSCRESCLRRVSCVVRSSA